MPQPIRALLAPHEMHDHRNMQEQKSSERAEIDDRNQQLQLIGKRQPDDDIGACNKKYGSVGNFARCMNMSEESRQLPISRHSIQQPRRRDLRSESPRYSGKYELERYDGHK